MVFLIKDYKSKFNAMKNTETDSIATSYAETCGLDQCLDNRCLCTNNPNSESMISTNLNVNKKAYDNSKAFVNKSYEMVNNSLHESYFDMEGMDNARDFIDDFSDLYPNGIILVINNFKKSTDIDLLTSVFKNKLIYLIVYSQIIEKASLFSSENHKKIETKNFNCAVKTAYNLASNGQVILFQGVDKNFDLFSYL